MHVKANDAIQNILHGLEQHSALQSLVDIVPAVAELSHDWHDTPHFTACETSTGLQVVIKAGVTEAEMYWTEHLSSADAVLFPKVFAVNCLPARAGRGPVGFIASERIPYTLIGPAWEGKQSDMLLDAVTAFYQAARGIARHHISPLPLEEVQRWLPGGGSEHPPGDWRAVLDHVEEDYAWLLQTCPFEVCHGDLHVGNGLSRTPPPDGTALLIDLNPILQPWVFDAAWVEVCAWSDHRRRGTGYTIRQLAERRGSLGLPALPADVQEKAGRIALAWLAIRLWDPDHLEFMPGFKEATEAHINSGATVQR